MSSFEIIARDPHSAGRVGRLTTPHGVIETPAFMPVGTQGTVKGLTPAELRECGVQMILANTY
ncbi:MAG TPA: tRNA-guanine transglycosylase, partial [bacterium]|nr:tRNA-guanine transglycosylase [bacterium]